MPTAQVVFERMLREEVAPALRELGLRGSGQRFRLPSESHWALLAFQKSQWSDADEIRFTVNVMTVSETFGRHSPRRTPNSVGSPRLTRRLRRSSLASRRLGTGTAGSGC
jgi:hypothetical protein